MNIKFRSTLRSFKIKDNFSNDKIEDIKLFNKDYLNKLDIMELSQDKIDNLDVRSLYSIIKSQFKLQEKNYEEILSELREEYEEEIKSDKKNLVFQ